SREMLGWQAWYLRRADFRQRRLASSVCRAHRQACAPPHRATPCRGGTGWPRERRARPRRQRAAAAAPGRRLHTPAVRCKGAAIELFSRKTSENGSDIQEDRPTWSAAATDQIPCVCRIRSAACSPITTQVAIVFPVV